MIQLLIMKSTADIHLTYIASILNLSIKEDYFPGELKLTEASPIFKEKNDLEKESYRAVSVLPHVSKFFERIMYHR